MKAILPIFASMAAAMYGEPLHAAQEKKQKAKQPLTPIPEDYAVGTTFQFAGGLVTIVKRNRYKVQLKCALRGTRLGWKTMDDLL